jgi:hypothetical protein
MDPNQLAKGKNEQMNPYQSNTFNFNSPCDNQFVNLSGDYIEVNIHLNKGVEGDRKDMDKGEPASSEGQSGEIRNLAAGIVEAITQRHHEPHTPSSGLAPATIRE